MPRIAVSRLRLTVDGAERAPSARFRLEEALRLGVEDDGVRVLLIRRLALGRLPGEWTRAAEWTAQIEARMRDLTHRAVHALNPAAAQSEAVYFRSELEARAALAALLAAGKWPIGWFWRLAVPVWSGEAWTTAAPALLRDLLVRPGGKAALARLMVQALHDGIAEALFAPLTESELQTLWPELPKRETGREPIGDPLPPVSAPQAATAARRALASLSPSAVVMLRRRLLEEARRPFVQRMLAALVVLSEAPHVLAAPPFLVATVDAVLAVAAPRTAPRTREIPMTHSGQAAATTQSPATPAAGTTAIRNRSADRDTGSSEAALHGPGAAPVPSTHEALTVPASAPAGATAEPWEEHRSQAAGLFLLIQPLARLGLPDWLERHPAMAADGFAWALLRDIARRMPVPADDALWSSLLEPAAETDGDWLGAWRVGLDRWLRRRTGCKLADVVLRAGWLGGDETSIVIRFPLAAADIRLRRQAVDFDPGWVPWLGRSVTFLYRDRFAE